MDKFYLNGSTVERALDEREKYDIYKPYFDLSKIINDFMGIRKITYDDLKNRWIKANLPITKLNSMYFVDGNIETITLMDIMKLINILNMPLTLELVPITKNNKSLY